MIGVGGTVRVSRNIVVTAALNPMLGIDLDIGAGAVRLGFDDAEQLAGLLTDLARIVRHTTGVGALEVV
ncbi:hypothetical protein [Rhodococcus sp. 114MFTsu3.1]|uniref:hypothetical protein n=1 Tax=Rhodococcus sp. 114MFTsu3.1 TaxID=1172184 RepID=UPI00035F4326|nr:hypothetical protein [Rhodococcus sp. 114MFTsu3.1]